MVVYRIVWYTRRVQPLQVQRARGTYRPGLARGIDAILLGLARRLVAGCGIVQGGARASRVLSTCDDREEGRKVQ